MAYLLRKKRRNPTTGRTEVYYQIQHPGAKLVTLGYVTEAEAQEGLLLYKARLVQEQHGAAQGSNSCALAASPSPAEQKPSPFVREWWGDVTEPWPVWPDCPMKTWLSARGTRGKGLQNWDDSRRHLVRSLGHLKLDQLTRPVIDAYISGLRGEGYSDRTVQIRVGHLMRGLRTAEEYGTLVKVPNVPRPRVQVTRERVWATPVQAVALVDALERRRRDGRLSATSHTAILVGLSLGLRSGEIRHRRWCDLDLSAGTLAIRPVELPDGTTWCPKGFRECVVRVDPALLDLLSSVWHGLGCPAGWMFQSPRKAGWPIGSFKKALHGASLEAGLPRALHPHALRHTAATALAWNGASLRDLMDHCGWASEDMAKVYLHSTPDRLGALVTAASPLTGRLTATPVQVNTAQIPTSPTKRPRKAALTTPSHGVIDGDSMATNAAK